MRHGALFPLVGLLAVACCQAAHGTELIQVQEGIIERIRAQETPQLSVGLKEKDASTIRSESSSVTGDDRTFVVRLGYVVLCHDEPSLQDALGLVAALYTTWDTFVIHCDAAFSGCVQRAWDLLNTATRSVSDSEGRSLGALSAWLGSRHNLRVVSVIRASLWEFSLVEATLEGLGALVDMSTNHSAYDWDYAVTLPSNAWPMQTREELDRRLTRPIHRRTTNSSLEDEQYSPSNERISCGSKLNSVTVGVGTSPIAAGSPHANRGKLRMYKQVRDVLPVPLYFGSQWITLHRDLVRLIDVARREFQSEANPLVWPSQSVHLAQGHDVDVTNVISWLRFWHEVDNVRSRIKKCRHDAAACDRFSGSDAFIDVSSPTLGSLTVRAKGKHVAEAFCAASDETFFASLMMASPFAPNGEDIATVECAGVTRFEVWRPGKSHPEVLSRKLVENELHSTSYYYDGRIVEQTEAEREGYAFSFARKLPTGIMGEEMRRYLDQRRCASAASKAARARGFTC